MVGFVFVGFSWKKKKLRFNVLNKEIGIDISNKMPWPPYEYNKPMVWYIALFIPKSQQK
jgi:hypothetical protein